MLENHIILLMGIAGTGKMTIARSIANQNPSFKLVIHDIWTKQILELVGENAQAWWQLDEKGWMAINKMRDVMFYTMAEVCPKETNFVLATEMLAKDPYHQNYFEKVQNTAAIRGSIVTPVRLICDLDELLKRVQSNERAVYFKTRDVELIKKRFTEEEVFFSKLPNELTLDVTHLTSDEAAEKILQWVLTSRKI